MIVCVCVSVCLCVCMSVCVCVCVCVYVCACSIKYNPVNITYMEPSTRHIEITSDLRLYIVRHPSVHTYLYVTNEHDEHIVPPASIVVMDMQHKTELAPIPVTPHIFVCDGAKSEMYHVLYNGVVMLEMRNSGVLRAYRPIVKH